MATKTITFDDLDGSEDAETVRISLGDLAVDIDLSPANRDKVEKLLAPYFEHGRTVVRKQGGNSNTAEMRQWLQDQGHKVGDKGRIPEDLQATYRQAHQGA
jgi:Lsr2